MKPLPITHFLGLVLNDNEELCLPFSPNITNHLNIIHAGAQYTFAEISSGACMERTFPDYTDKVYAILRKSDVKYKNSGTKDLFSRTTIEDTIVEKARSDLATRGIALVPVDVKVHDAEQTITLEGTFTWFVKVL